MLNIIHLQYNDDIRLMIYEQKLILAQLHV